MSSRPDVRSYLHLLRPANLVTAAADILAGYAIAGLGNPPALPWLIAASVALYGGGVVLNDYFDRELDARERPERPIPSGRVPAGAAAALGGALLVAGVLCAAQTTRYGALIAAGTAACILIYDAWGKRRWFGPLNMGACRALNLGLGMSAVPSMLAAHGWLAVLPLAYVTAVTAVSRGEVHGGSGAAGLGALISLGGVVALLGALCLRPGRQSLAALAIVALLAWRVLPAYYRAWREPRAATVRTAVRIGVLSLVLLDAALGTAYAGPIYGVGILATAVVAAALSRLFAVT